MSVTDKGIVLSQDARSRLQQAALELFASDGFEAVTAAQIAERAGVTERTFFRHFSDKREVLFDGQNVLLAALKAGLADAPANASELAALFHAFRSVVPLLEANRPFSEPRQRIIAANPALKEREAAKLTVLVDEMTEALIPRSKSDLRARLAATTGIAAFAMATTAWLEDGEPDLLSHLTRIEEELRSLGSDFGS